MVKYNHLIIILLIILKSFACPLTAVKMIVSLHPKAKHNSMITIQITFSCHIIVCYGWNFFSYH